MKNVQVSKFSTQVVMKGVALLTAVAALIIQANRAVSYSIQQYSARLLMFSVYEQD